MRSEFYNIVLKFVLKITPALFIFWISVNNIHARQVLPQERVSNIAGSTGESKQKKEEDKKVTTQKKPDQPEQINSRTVKKVNGARPDMSKARGARPPDIKRPSGAGIPKGIGKPGGAMKPGKK